MLTIGTGVYFQFLNGPSADKRVLHAATIAAFSDGRYAACLNEPELELQPGTPARLYFKRQGRFVHQSVEISTVMTDNDGRPRIGFQLQGQPASAEGRQCFRVSTVTTDHTIDLGDEFGCPLLDVSATGFSASAASVLKPGDVVAVQLTYEGIAYRGRARVQNVRPLGRGRRRYGCHCLDHPHQGARNLARGLQTLSMAVQRAQLRRLAGSA